jgi:hypothetical protein
MAARNRVGTELSYRLASLAGRYDKPIFLYSVLSTHRLFRARICKPFKEPRNRFSAWRAGTTTLFVVPACQATYRIAESIPWNRFLGSINVYKYGLCTASFAAAWSHGKDDIYVILFYGGVLYYCISKIKIKTRKEEHNEDF